MTDFPKLMTLLDLKRDDLRPMTEDESKLQITVHFNPALNAKQPIEDPLLAGMEDDTLPFVVLVMLKRLRAHVPGIKIAPGLILWTAQQCKGPGEAVMFAHAICRMHRENLPLTVESMIDRAFGYGVPSDAGKQKVWDAQKGYTQDPPLKGVDNLIDQPGAWA